MPKSKYTNEQNYILFLKDEMEWISYGLDSVISLAIFAKTSSDASEQIQILEETVNGCLTDMEISINGIRGTIPFINKEIARGKKL